MPIDNPTVTEGTAIPFAGTIYFVSANDGNDANNGLAANTAFLTIQHAIDTAAAGDGITIMAGAYDEVIDVDENALELWFEIGATLTNSAAGAVVLTVSANYCYVRGELVITPGAGDTGIHVTGNGAVIEKVNVVTGAVGFRLAGVGAKVKECGCFQPTTTAFWVEGDRTRIIDCRTTGANAATIGFHINNGADFARLENCESTGHGTAGFEIDAGSEYCVVANSRSGAGDGARIDNGEYMLWANFVERLETEYHEAIYPSSDGAGTAGVPVTLSNATTDDAAGTREDQDYWGDIAIIMAPATVVVPWWSLGIYIAATTANDDQQFQCLFTRPAYSSAQNGGNDWDHTETALTVVDGTLFEADDLVWITGNDRPAGEIQKVVSSVANVVTVVSETRASGGLGLRYDYDTDDSANTMFLVYRATDRRFHATNGSYSASGARDHARYLWETPRRILPNGAMIMRMLNATDAAASTFDVRSIYMD